MNAEQHERLRRAINTAMLDETIDCLPPEERDRQSDAAHVEELDGMWDGMVGAVMDALGVTAEYVEADDGSMLLVNDGVVMSESGLGIAPDDRCLFSIRALESDASAP